jgi:hypothetical protein
MTQDWLIHQIEGLRDHAALNGLPRLAAALDQARLVGLLEMAPAGGSEPARPAAGPGGTGPED